MERRDFITSSMIGCIGSAALPFGWKHSNKVSGTGPELPFFKVRKLTHGPNHHFFGYYGMTPWNQSESKMVCLESTFQDRLPNPGETATIGIVDPISGVFTAIEETLAWNLQQGCLLHWNPLAPEKEIIYNDNVNGAYMSAVLNVNTGEKRFLPRPISVVCRKGKYALSLTYERLSRLRKVVGYAGAVDPYADQAHPKEDGVYRIDLETDETKLLVSIAEVYERSVGQYPELKDRHMWFNHTDINPSGTRFLFLARSRGKKGKKGKLDSSMFTVNIDGTDLRQVVPFGTGVSHFGWRNDNEIIATFKFPGDKKLKHVIFQDGVQDYKVVGEEFIIDNGHCTFSPDGNWMATDRKQDESRSQSLWLYDMKLDKGMLLANMTVNEDEKYLHSNTRCDFHPRWNRSGNKICFDAIDTATRSRQMHLVEFVDKDKNK